MIFVRCVFLLLYLNWAVISDWNFQWRHLINGFNPGFFLLSMFIYGNWNRNQRLQNCYCDKFCYCRLQMIFRSKLYHSQSNVKKHVELLFRFGLEMFCLGLEMFLRLRITQVNLLLQLIVTHFLYWLKLSCIRFNFIINCLSLNELFSIYLLWFIVPVCFNEICYLSSQYNWFNHIVWGQWNQKRSNIDWIFRIRGVSLLLKTTEIVHIHCLWCAIDPMITVCD